MQVLTPMQVPHEHTGMIHCTWPATSTPTPASKAFVLCEHGVSKGMVAMVAPAFVSVLVPGRAKAVR